VTKIEELKEAVIDAARNDTRAAKAVYAEARACRDAANLDEAYRHDNVLLALRSMHCAYSRNLVAAVTALEEAEAEERRAVLDKFAEAEDDAYAESLERTDP